MHFDNWIFILLVFVAMLFRWLSSAAGKASRDSDDASPGPASSPPPLPRPARESDTDRIRKFLEALGQPAGSQPPPPVAHRTDIPPRPVAPVRPPASPFPFPPRSLSREEKRKQIVILPKSPSSPPPERRDEAKVVPVELAPPPVFEPAAPLKPVEAYVIAKPVSPTAAKIDILSLLGSAKGLRDALILREILGPPRSLQPLDLFGSA